jgi:glycosyltransferase involved in cell wall biosynthesis
MTAPEHKAAGLRVLFVSHWFPRHEADWGGIFVLEQARSLRSAGLDVRQPGSIARGLHDFAKSSPPCWQAQQGVPVAYVPMLTPHPRHWGLLAPRAYIASLWRWQKALLADFDPQILHAHTAFLDGYAAAWLARRLGVPMVLSEGTGPFSTLTRTSAQRRLTQSAVNAADLLLPVSNFQKRAISAAVDVSPQLPIRVLGNGFDPEIFKPTPLPPPAPARFLWIGRLDDNKQPFLLLDAFASALTQRPDMRLNLLGDGPLLATIERRIMEPDLGGKVELRPPTDRAGIAAALREHAALVISSQTETFGVVAIEALGSGRPVLTTRCGGPEEIVAATDGGLVVDNSVEALAEGFLHVAANAAHNDPWAMALTAANHYGSKMIAQALIENYIQLRESRPST